jgi:hypothetical protein
LLFATFQSRRETGTAEQDRDRQIGLKAIKSAEKDAVFIFCVSAAGPLSCTPAPAVSMRTVSHELRQSQHTRRVADQSMHLVVIKRNPCSFSSPIVRCGAVQ